MAYTPEQYAAAGQWIAANLDNPDLIASTASSMGLSANDLLAAVQTVNPNLSIGDVTAYFEQAGSSYRPKVDTAEPEPVPAPIVNESPTPVGGALASAAPKVEIEETDPIAAGGSTPARGALQRSIGFTEQDSYQEDSGIPISVGNPEEMTDYRGRTYKTDEVLELAGQIAPLVDLTQSSGGVFGTERQSVGFDFDQTAAVLGRAPSAAEQVVIDMARQLIDSGVTEVAQLSELKPQTFTDTEVTEQGDYTTQRQGFVDPFGKEFSSTFGSTYTGLGGTMYNLMVGEGGPKITTSGVSTSDLDKVGPALTILSFIPATAPFAQVLNGVIAASQGNVLGAGASLLGAGGFADASAVLRAADAAQKGNVMGALSTLAGTTIGAELAGTSLGGNITLGDTLNAANTITKIQTGDIVGALDSASKLTGSTDMQTAATALKVIKAVESGNFNAAITAAGQLINTIDKATANSQVAALATAGSESLDAKQDLGAAAFAAAKAAGADDATAFETAKAATVGTVTPAAAATSRDTTYDPDLVDATAGQALATKIANAQEAIRMGAGESVGTGEIKAGAGEFAGAGASQTVSEKISNAPNFGAAYAAAREAFGPNATFNYQGKLYSTATAEERPDLAVKTTEKVASDNQKSLDLTGATEWDLNLMSKPLGFDSFNATTARLMSPQEFKSLLNDSKLSIDPSTLDQRYQAYLYSQAPRVNAGQRASLPIELAYRPPADIYEKAPTTFDEFKNMVLSGVAAGSRVASGAQNVINSLVTNLTGAATGAIAGATSSITGDPANVVSSSLRQLADIATSASDVAVPELAVGAQNIAKAVDEAKGFDGKVLALGKSVLENPGAAFWWGAKETSEELVPMAIAAKVLRLTGNVGATAAADAFTNFVETQGLTQEQLQKGFEDLGLTPQQAAQASSPGAFAQGAAEGLLSPLWEIPAIKAIAGKMTNEVANVSQTLGSKVGTVTKAGAGETIKEGTEEMAGEGAKQLVMTGGIDPNAVLTAGVIGGPLGGKASSTITGIELSSAGANADLISKLNGAAVDFQGVSNAVNNLQSLYGSDKASTIVQTLTSASDLNAAGQSIAKDLSSIMGDDAAVKTANTLVSNFAVNNAADTMATQGLNVNNLSTVVGNTDTGGTITLGDALGAAITGNGIGVDTSTVVGTKSDGSSLTLGELTGAVKGGGTSVTAGTDTTTKAGVSTATDTTAQAGTATDTKSGVTTDTKSGVTTDTTTDTNTNTTTQTTTDTNTNTTTQTATNATTNVTTQVTTNNNTGATTTVTTDPTLGTTTQTTTTTNGTSTTTVDTTSNVTTNVTTDTTTGINTEIVLNSDTGEVVITKVDPVNDEVIETVTKTEAELTPEEKEKLEVSEPEPVTKATEKKPTTKKPAAKAPTGGGMLLGQGPQATSKIEMPEEAWLGGRFRTDLPSIAAMFPFLFPSQEQQDTAAVSALRRASGVEPQVPKKEDMDYYAYGKEPSIDSVLEPYLNGGSVQKYAQGGIIMPSALQAAAGGTPHKGSHYVQGAGGGQDDLIPARLADGEYVFDAEIVAALGDGSNKEGARRLDAMREAIRKHKRSGSLKKIPPPAKNPLAYFKEANK